MTSHKDLKEALKEALESRGMMTELRRKVRVDIFKCLNDDLSPPHVLAENALINELITEYLIFNGYGQSLSAFLDETQQSTKRGSRHQLEEKLNLKVDESLKDIPLLYPLCLRTALKNVDPFSGLSTKERRNEK
ncbi:hypothetical protein BKA69DRAFT_1121986 [Paraphysoderma sedebokerense]|nr:hypothetical protein BKA69DRAFT_1121986 [Paraphysoderma sedebokerense]